MAVWWNEEILERQRPHAITPTNSNSRLKRNQHYGQIGSVRGDAMIAHAENGVQPVFALNRTTA